MEKQYVQFGDGTVIGLVKNSNGSLEIHKDGVPKGRVQVWDDPTPVTGDS